MLNSFIGVGLRQPHYSNFIDSKPDIGWVEVHSENYICCGGNSFDTLIKIRKDYPVSLHGIAMSLGSADGVDFDYLRQLKKLISIVEPHFVSDHISWSSKNNYFLPDLLPIPYTDESLKILTNNINIAQDFLNRQILFENPSTYFEYNSSAYQEPVFLNILAEKTGAGILLDVNNVYVSSKNHNWSAINYLNSIKSEYIQELHLGGHSKHITENGEKILIDTHDDVICQEVWDLYQHILSITGKITTLIEWDEKIPSFEKLLLEAEKAKAHMQKINNLGYV